MICVDYSSGMAFNYEQFLLLVAHFTVVNV